MTATIIPLRPYKQNKVRSLLTRVAKNIMKIIQIEEKEYIIKWTGNVEFPQVALEGHLLEFRQSGWVIYKTLEINKNKNPKVFGLYERTMTSGGPKREEHQLTIWKI